MESHLSFRVLLELLSYDTLTLNLLLRGLVVPCSCSTKHSGKNLPHFWNNVIDPRLFFKRHVCLANFVLLSCSSCLLEIRSRVVWESSHHTDKTLQQFSSPRMRFLIPQDIILSYPRRTILLKSSMLTFWLLRLDAFQLFSSVCPSLIVNTSCRHIDYFHFGVPVRKSPSRIFVGPSLFVFRGILFKVE